MNNLDVRLGEAGRRAEGLTAAREAIDYYQKLARIEPAVFRAGPFDRTLAGVSE